MYKSPPISIPQRILCFKLFIFSFLLLALTSCEYKPTGTNYVEKELLDGDINWFFPPLDEEFLIYDYLDISYNFALDNLDLDKITFNLGSSRVAQTHTNQGSFRIEASDFPDGNYILEARIRTESTSNSLADYLDNEQYLTTVQWPVIIDNSPLPQVQITSIERFEGKLKICWDQYDGILFEKYKLRVGDDDINLYDQLNPCYVDTLFCGGNIDCRVMLYAHEDCTYSDFVEYTDWQPENIAYTFDENNKLILNWDPAYYESISSFIIGSSLGSSLSYVGETTSAADNSWLDQDRSLKFGRSFNYCVTTKNLLNINDFPDWQEMESAENVIEIFQGQDLGKSFSNMTYNENGYFYTSSNYSISCFELATKNEIAEIEYDYASTNVNYLSQSNSLFYTQNNNITQLDPLSLEELACWEGSALFSEGYNFSDFAASTNRLVVSGGVGYPYYGGYIIDLPECDVRYLSNLDEDLTISEDGVYVADNNRLWMITETDEEVIAELNNYTFKKILSNDRILLITGYEAEVRNLSDFNLIRTFPVNGSGFIYHLSQDKQFIYRTSFNILEIIRVSDGEVILELDVCNGINYYYLDNTVFSPAGYYLEVN